MFRTKFVEKTQFLFSTFFANHAVYEKMWKNIVERGRPQITNMAHTHCMLDT